MNAKKNLPKTLLINAPSLKLKTYYSVCVHRAVGCLSLEEPPYADISRTANCVRKFGNECQLLNGDELRRRFPMLKFPPEVSASFEPTSGMLFADKCLKTLQVGEENPLAFSEYGLKRECY